METLLVPPVRVLSHEGRSVVREVAPGVHAAAVVKRIERALRATGLPDGKGQKGTALESALYTVREGHSRFYEPLDDVADAVLVACTKSPHLIAALAEASTRWTSTALHAFVLIAGYTGSWNLQHQYVAQAWDPKVKRQAEVFQARLRELFAALPASTDRTVSRRLVQWGLLPGHTSKLPERDPVERLCVTERVAGLRCGRVAAVLSEHEESLRGGDPRRGGDGVWNEGVVHLARAGWRGSGRLHLA